MSLWNVVILFLLCDDTPSARVWLKLICSWHIIYKINKTSYWRHSLINGTNLWSNRPNYTIVNPVSIVSRGPVLTKTWAIKPLAAGRLFVMIIRSLFVLIDGADPSSSQWWSALVSFQSATMFLWLWEYHTGRCNCIETHILGFVLKTIYFHLITGIMPSNFK